MFKDLKNFFSKKETPQKIDNSTNSAVLRIIYEIIAADHIIKDEEIKNLNLDTHYDYINFGILLDNIFVMDDFLLVDAIT